MSAMAFDGIDFDAIRRALAGLSRAENVTPDGVIDPADIFPVGEHRAALDPERVLVVGNRGMGKSFWTHALANLTARRTIADALRLPELATTHVCIGFNASTRTGDVAPTPDALRAALDKVGDAEAVWRSVLVRATSVLPGGAVADLPTTFSEVVAWVRADPERAERLLTQADERIAAGRGRLLVVFDALDRLASTWTTTRVLTKALLQSALAARSYRALRLKLFMRTDQYADASLFEFPDGSKIKNTRVDLTWSSDDLYGLLFHRLARSADGALAFAELTRRIGRQAALPGFPGDRNQALVNVIAGEFMGADKKRGRVFTWLPLHLADAHRETSPRTFLTAWREAARTAGPPPPDRAVDHLGLLEGVRKASEDRLQELREDYWWIDAALAPLRGQMVPMEAAMLDDLWRRNDTARSIVDESSKRALLAPVQLENEKDPVSALRAALASIGVMEVRTTGKIDVPDIFRIEAGIKRKGGVRPPRRTRERE